MRVRPGLVETLSCSFASAQEAFHKFLLSNIVKEGLHCTKLQGRKVASQSSKT